MQSSLRPLQLLATLLLLLSTLPLNAAVEELDQIVAVVNEDIIARSELDSSTRELATQLLEKGTGLPARNILERQVLERMISKRLQMQAAKQLGVSVDDATLSKTISNIAKRNNITLGELRDTLESDGINFTLFREKLRRDIIISRLKQKEVINRIVVTDQDVRNFLAREAGGNRQRSALHLQHILIATPEGAAPEDIQAAKKQAGDLVVQLREDADFGEVAVRESDGRQALEGGDLGWIEAARIPSIFTQVVDSMEPGDISDPIRNASGFHIVKLLETEGAKRHLITQTHARHILVNTNEIVSDSEALHNLETLRTRLENGEDFSTLARSHSDDKASAIKGGDLGWTSSGDMVPQFEKQMDTLEPGGISHPFQTQFGWHIVQVLERREHDNTEEMIRTSARKAIRKQKAEEATDLWLRRLRDEAYVEIHLEQEPG
ncbi:molecular chaperone SurA [bacterium endosymbiont of Escarpia laminata]|nr:MAG: molecular chaperone SurA [bacterium endosymbiont of Escarpia laminata]